MSSARMAWPYVAGVVALVAAPAAGAFALSFTEFTGVEPPRFTGFANFTRLLADPAYWRSLGNSLVYIAIAVPARLTVAVAFALLLHRRHAGSGTARAIGYLPTVVPDAAYALLWLWILNPLYGPLAAALGAAGIDPPGWLTEPWAARVAIPLMSAFQIGEAFLIALAARSALSDRLYEVAELEGATPWFTLTRVTLPAMAPVLTLLALRDAILSFQMNFVPAMLVTEGGPRYATTYLSLYTYQAGFRYFRFGYAAAIALTMFVMTAAVVLAQYRLAKRWRLA